MSSTPEVGDGFNAPPPEPRVSGPTDTLAGRWPSGSAGGAEGNGRALATTAVI
ncbi:MAG: hypothetical protein ACP5UT_10310 [Bryobacteraceae bacterium]